jgi:tetratricopeptide (TPR) repeat protein
VTSFRCGGAVVGLLLAFTAVSFAQLSAFEGEVKGADGKPVMGATVKFVRLDVNRTYQVKTDKKGRYFYGSLPLGFYAVGVQVDGRDVAAVSGIRSQPGDPIQISFDLSATAEQHAARAIDAIRRVRGEWSFVKPVVIPGADGRPATAQSAVAPAIAEPSRNLSPEQQAAMEKEISERAALLKQQAELNDAFKSGLAAIETRRYDDAIAALNKAVELDPKQEAVWANLGSAYSGSADGKTGPAFEQAIQKSLEAYAKAVDLNPDDAGIRYRYALALAKAKKYDDMRIQCKKSAELDPPNAYRTYYNLGALLINAGQTEPAIEAFQAAIAAAPDEPLNAESYYQYGVGLMAKAQTDSNGKIVPPPGTAEGLRKYLQLAPNGPNAQAAKDILASLNTSVETRFVDPKDTRKK